MERRQFIAGGAVAAISVSALPIAAAAAGTDRVEWDRAMSRFKEAEALADRHYSQVYLPLSNKAERVEDAAGLDRARFGFWERRKAFVNVNPNLYHDLNAASDECDRLGDAVADTLGDLMDTPAPDLAALRWKLDQLRDERDGSLQSYTASFTEQAYTDMARLMPPAA